MKKRIVLSNVMGNSNGCEKTVFIHMTDRYEGIQTTKTKRTNKKLRGLRDLVQEAQMNIVETLVNCLHI